MVVFCPLPELYAQDYEFRDEPLLNVIHEVEKRSDVKFLYRESLVAGVRLDLICEAGEVFPELIKELSRINIGLKVDQTRKQALLFSNGGRPSANEVRISGYILDDETGERLPFATVSWLEHGSLTGTAASLNGVFHAIIPTDQESLSLLFSFTGYDPLRLELDLSEQTTWVDLAIRLSPGAYSSKEIVVRGSYMYNASDSLFDGLIKMGAFSPLGEVNSIRSLQTLPAVQTESAVNDGLSVRGSSPDGFRVLLDGQTMYNQSHLFGLIDAMNADILKTSGFFYDVTPAEFRAPHGGVLSLITKTGALQEVSGSGGFSNTALNATVEGPIRKGRASWLVSGRFSLLDQMDWLNNRSLIEFGLDIDRPFDFQDPVYEAITQRNRTVLSTSAAFYDLHSKVYVERANGSQIILSAYVGEDEASQNYSRRIFNNTLDFETSNNWSNKILSASYHTQPGTRTSSRSHLGFSDYYSDYLKTDAAAIAETIQNGDRSSIEITISPLILDNELREFNAGQSFTTHFDTGSLKYGVAYSDFEVEYRELRLQADSFRSRRTSQLLDLYGEVELRPGNEASVQLGNRLYYYSNGKYLNYSPRIMVRFFPASDVSAGIGFSKNYQYLHRLDFFNINSTDFWIMTNEDQPPSGTTYYSANLRMNLSDRFYLQVEGYYKIFENLRIHGLNTQLISLTFQEEETPWYHQNNGTGKGIEFFARHRYDRVQLSGTYTLSSMELENILINEGAPFYPDWDRRHQFSLMGDLKVASGLTLYAVWNYATGAPSRILNDRNSEQSRLGDYSRIDMSLVYRYVFDSGHTLDLTASVYNFLDRKNPWYTDIRQGRNTSTRRVEAAAVEVYDLGFQPGFKVSVGF